MAVLIKDRKTERKQGILFALPVAAGAHIYAGSLVSVNANGYVVPASDTAGHAFLGVARKEADNSAGADGARNCEGYMAGLFEMNSTGVTQADLAAEAYVADDNTVGTGIIAQPVNVTGVVLERTPLSAGGAHALAFTAAGSLLAWGGGAGVAASADGVYTLTAPDGATIKAVVTFASLPVADQTDNIQLRRVRAGRIIEIVSAGSIFLDISTPARS